MIRSTVRRLGARVLRAATGSPGRAGGPLAQLGEAHHETRQRLVQLEEAHGRTAATANGLAEAHHDTATTARQALAEATEARREAESVSAHLPTLLSVLSSANGVARESRRNQEAAAAELARLAADTASLTTHVANLARFVEDQGAAMTALAEQLQATQEATTQAFTDVGARIGRVEGRVDSVRREVMFEVRYGADAGSDGAGLRGAIETQVLNPDKLQGGEPLRLNLGSGHLVLDDHVNVDARELAGVDMVADVRKLPFDPETVEEVRSAHLLEHFPLEELSRVVLPHWHSILRPGGTLRAVVPDAGTMLGEFAAGRMPFEDLRLVTFGEQEYDGDFHFTMFTEQSLTELLEAAGFEDVVVEEAGRRNGACYEMELVARKPVRPAHP